MPNFSVKINSLGKVLHRLRTSNSKLQRQIESLLKLAKEIKDESKFQKMPQYQKFKAQKIGHRSEIKYLIEGFHTEEVNFHNECIFWCNKMFQERVCDKNERYVYLYVLTTCHFSIASYLKTIEYGQKFLDLQVQIEEENHNFTLSHKSGLISRMVASSKKLQRDEDTMKYLKEKLKLDVLRFNNGEITELILLAIYYELLVFQARTKNFKNGLKTLKSLKLYNINSMDVCDVIKVMESRDYKKYFPLSLLHRDFDITEDSGRYSSLVMEHYSDISRNQKEMKESKKMRNLCLALAHIFMVKCEILQNLGDKENCEKWANLHYVFYYDIQFHLRAMKSFGAIENCGHECDDFLLCETIAAGIRLSLTVPTRRTEIFRDLYPAILGREDSVGEYLSATSKHFSLSIDHLMPFVQFCIKNFDDFKVHDQQSQTNSKLDIISYKNSLYIMKKFQMNLPRIASEVNQNEDIKFDVFHKFDE